MRTLVTPTAITSISKFFSSASRYAILLSSTIVEITRANASHYLSWPLTQSSPVHKYCLTFTLWSIWMLAKTRKSKGVNSNRSVSLLRSQAILHSNVLKQRISFPFLLPLISSKHLLFPAIPSRWKRLQKHNTSMRQLNSIRSFIKCWLKEVLGTITKWETSGHWSPKSTKDGILWTIIHFWPSSLIDKSKRLDTA